MKSNLTDHQKKWLSNEFWSTPDWISATYNLQTLKSYEDYQLFNLRIKYLELETEFRLVFKQNHSADGFSEFGMSYAEKIVELLEVCKSGLESNTSKINFLMNISFTLGLIDRNLIWLYNHPRVMRYYNLLIGKTKKEYPLLAQVLIQSRNDIRRIEDVVIASAVLRDAYVTGLGELKKIELQKAISFGLQIERLKVLIKGGIFAAILILVSSPLFLNDLKEFLPENLFPMSGFTIVDSWLIMLGAFIIGGFGGFFSGLLQVKSNKVSLEEYKESRLKFLLKPILGGITALILFVFLSWQILPGITIDNFGSNLLIVFLAGFSERYFLNLLQVDQEELEEQNLGNIQPLESDSEFIESVYSDEDLKTLEKNKDKIEN